MNRTALSLTVAAGLLVAIASACGGKSTCVSGMSSSCTCSNGQAGAQVCQADGSFGACSCTSGSGGGSGQSGGGAVASGGGNGTGGGSSGGGSGGGMGKRLFVTAQLYGGNLGGLAGADQKCTTSAAAGNLGGVWQAWLSDGTTDAVSRFADAGAWYDLDGRKIFNNSANLTTVPLDQLRVDEQGQLVDYGFAWTGTSNGGTRSGKHCRGWTSQDAGSPDDTGTHGIIGVSSYTSTWTDSTSPYGCNQQLHLICLEK
ncbi:MAG: hypothetical protein K1X89_20995 [Myxococcaceae bacterium]|nr:hypothetical protein [Myxococcaceae bacterium]